MYYSEYIDNPEQELKIPTISKSSNYFFSKLSTFENFRKINESMARTDNYNLYILFDKHMGTKDSLFNRFIILNNKINEDINLTFTKINILEEEIENNLEILETGQIEEYKKYKAKYDMGMLGFGYYLSKLKEIELKIEKNKNEDLEKTKLEDSKILACKGLIKSIKDYNNLYFKELVNIFESETNNDLKIAACNKIDLIISRTDCFQNIEELIFAGYLLNANIESNEECVDVLSQLNYSLRNNEKIELFWRVFAEDAKLLESLKALDLDFDKEILLANYQTTLDDYKDKENYELILEINKYLETVTQTNKELKEMWGKEIAKEIINTKIIYYDVGAYFLKIVNPSSDTIKDLCFENSELGVVGAKAISDKFKITNKNTCFDNLYPGANVFEMGYENQKTVETRLISLGIEQTLFEARIKNTVVGMYDTLNVGQARIIDSGQYNLRSDGVIEYLTEKENKILYYLNIFDAEILDKNFAIAEDETLIAIEKIKIKNIYPEKVCGTLAFIECKSGLAKLIINGAKENIDYYNEYEKISASVCFETNETKIVETYCAIDETELQETAKDLLIKMNELMTCEFKDISEESNVEFKEIFEKLKSKDILNYDEIMEIYKYSKKIPELEERLIEKKDYLDKTKTLISKMQEFQLLAEDEQEIEEIEEMSLVDSKNAYAKAKNLYDKLNSRSEALDELKEDNYKIKLDDLKELANETGVMDFELQNKFSEVPEQGVNEENINALETEIENNIIQKSKNYSAWLLYFKELDKQEIANQLFEIEVAYSEVDIKELYAVKYYPTITLDDTERIKKKLAFLDTVKLKEETAKFFYEYDSQNNSKALTLIDSTTIDRLIDLNKEINLLSSGLRQIRKDANIELNRVAVSKLYSKNKEVIANLKKEYENRNYLKVIIDSRVLLSAIPKNNNVNFGQIVPLGIGGLIILALLFNKKPKTLSKDEKKQKILRHY